MKIELKQTDRGVQFSVRAKPNSKKNAIEGVFNGTLKIAVTAAPENGQANKAIVNLLAKKLKLAKSKFEIVRGHSSRDKTVLIENVTCVEFLERVKSGLSE